MGEYNLNFDTKDVFYEESKRLRKEVLLLADSLKNNPLRFSVTNEIRMDVEITKSDLKTIVSKNTQDNRFNVVKNTLAKNLRSFLEKGKYEGWRKVVYGKHPETAYFVYYSQEYEMKVYLCVRKMKNTGIFKPYAIIDQTMFESESGNLIKEEPLD